MSLPVSKRRFSFYYLRHRCRRQGSPRLHHHPTIAVHATKMSERALHDLPLIRHPGAITNVITRFTAGAERDADGGLRFRYVVQGAIGRIALPAKAIARHTDNLWRHTCFEAFITAESNPAYVECNFAPSRAWATYRFDGYRQSMATIVPSDPPCITVQKGRNSLVLEARLRLGEFTGDPLRIGLTAVIEDKAGGISYWALRHPRTHTKPDFHHRGGFILRLATSPARTKGKKI